jgi:hypothetical protein
MRPSGGPPVPRLLLYAAFGVVAAWLLGQADAPETARLRAQEEGSRANVLWFRAPARNWNEALPVGSGRLGAMVFGGITDERLQLNEDTVWAGQKLDGSILQARRPSPRSGALSLAGKPAEAEALADKAVIAVRAGCRRFKRSAISRYRFDRTLRSAITDASWT